jgi:hypothetical protein
LVGSVGLVGSKDKVGLSEIVIDSLGNTIDSGLTFYELAAMSQANETELEVVLDQLVKDGRVFQPSPGRYRLI